VKYQRSLVVYFVMLLVKKFTGTSVPVIAKAEEKEGGKDEVKGEVKGAKAVKEQE